MLRLVKNLSAGKVTLENEEAIGEKRRCLISLSTPPCMSPGNCHTRVRQVGDESGMEIKVTVLASGTEILCTEVSFAATLCYVEEGLSTKMC